MQKLERKIQIEKKAIKKLTLFRNYPSEKSNLRKRRFGSNWTFK
jgi:hypothetical protein